MRIQILLVATVLLAWNATAQTFTNYTTVDGLLSDNVNCVDVDGADNLWFGTQAGVSMFDGATWTDYSTSNTPNLIDDNITAIFSASSGDIWVGSDFGVSVFSGGAWTSYTTLDGLGNDQIKCISEDANGDIWFGTSSGATELSGATWTSYGTSNGLPFGGVTAITLQNDGTLWMGSGLGGVWRFDGTNFTGITIADGLVDNRLRAIALDNQDQRWFGTSEGISVFNTSNNFVTNHTTIFSLPAPDTLNPIEDVKVDNSGNIWVGVYVDYLVTQGGVCAYDGSQWFEYKVADGLVGPVVRALAIDASNNVWVATSTGVSKISNHSIGLNENTTTNFRIYPNPANNVVYIDGLSSQEDIELKVYNAAMQEMPIAFSAFSPTTAKLGLDEYASGMYFIQINGETHKILLR